MNLPFGLGKTSLAFWLSYALHGGDPNDTDETNDVWDEVFQDLAYYPSKLIRMLIPKEGTSNSNPIPNVIYDDVQMTAPATQSVPAPIREMASYITTNRPECRTLTLTAPNVNSIAAPLRKLVCYELIVWERGRYEVQQILYHKNFHDPLQDKVELAFIEGTEDTSIFDPLPPKILERYNIWRAKEKAPFARRIIQKLERYEAKIETLEEAPPEEMTIMAKRMAQRRWAKK